MPRVFFVVLIVGLSAISLSGQQLVRVHEPLDVAMPPLMAANWEKPLGSVRDGATCVKWSISTPWPLGATTARLDVLVGDGLRWQWLFAQRADDATKSLCFPLPPPGSRVGVLLRDVAQRGVYAWAETRVSNLPAVWELKRYKSMKITTRDPSDRVLVLNECEQDARVGKSVGHSSSALSFLPLSPSLVCEIGIDGNGTCSRVESNSIEARLNHQSWAPVRLVRFESDVPTEIEVLAEGSSLARPRKVNFSMRELKTWAALTIGADQRWEDVVVDMRWAAAATQRLAGEALLPPPSFARILDIKDRGLSVKAFVGDGAESLNDPEAALLVFPSSGAVAGRIPIGTARQSADGLFHFPDLGAGQYRLRLISSFSDSRDVLSSLAANEVAPVQFARGILVSGRVVLSAGGSAPRPPTIQVIRASRVTQSEQKQGLDPADVLKQVSASSTGRFEFAVPVPGEYRLRAVWGNGRAEKLFTVDKDDVDVGTIELVSGATIRGRVEGCAAGELRLVPLPELDKSQTSSFFDYVRAPIDSDSKFFVGNIATGQWLVTAKCHEKTFNVEPYVIVIPPTGDVIADFNIQK